MHDKRIQSRDHSSIPSSSSFSSTQLWAKGRAQFSTPTTTSSDSSSSSTSLIDTVFTFVSSDLGGVVFGLLGLCLCLYNRLSHLDYLDIDTSQSTLLAQQVGQQARSDLLAVFATMAVFLNGVSKLDVTSALAESVVLEGVALESPYAIKELLSSTSLDGIGISGSGSGSIEWAMNAVLDATPAQTAMLLVYKEDNTNDDNNLPSNWIPAAYAGIVTNQIQSLVTQSQNEDDVLLPSAVNVKTPILDRFVLDKTKQMQRKESYLPTLQALPGKVEFTYLPNNTQEALLLPVRMPSDNDDNNNNNVSVLVVGSDTAKSFTPRDIAWCQVLAARMGEFLS